MMIIYPIPELLPDHRARFIQIINTCLGLASQGVRVRLVAGIKKGYSEKDVFDFYGVSQPRNLELVRLPVLRREDERFLKVSWHGLFNIFLLLKLFSWRSEGDAPVLFLRHLKLAAFILKFKKMLKMPVIFEAHEVFHLNTGGKGREEKTRRLEKKVYRGSDSIIAITNSLKGCLIEMGIGEGLVSIAHDGVKEEWFDTSWKAPGEYICYAGSLHEWKGVDELIGAMKYLPDERLVIVGGGARLDRLKELAVGAGVGERVAFAGNVPHQSVPGYLSRAKVAVLPNIDKGLTRFSSPLKLFEYMASGVPIVASDLQVFKEVLEDGRNALLARPGDCKELACRIKELAGDHLLSLKIGGAARADARGYTYANRAIKILDAINVTVAQRKKRGQG
ncbi:MAG: glycosyltransferase [Deltaproteobacteria bacterium]|nr:glycosyltransferase [Deltaproteobacteria bacterium]